MNILATDEQKWKTYFFSLTISLKILPISLLRILSSFPYHKKIMFPKGSRKSLILFAFFVFSPTHQNSSENAKLNSESKAYDERSSFNDEKLLFIFYIPLYANKRRGKNGHFLEGKGREGMKWKAVKISKNIIVKHLIIKSLKFHGFYTSHNDNTMMMRKRRRVKIMTL